jgi:hypothetical protein
MTISILEFGPAYGVSSNIGTYRWNGHSFNPTGDKTDGYQTWNPWTESWDGVTRYLPVDSFNLGSMQQGNEVVASLIKFSTDIADWGIVTLRYKDPQGNILFTISYSWNMGAGYWYSVWAGVGIKGNDHNEIHENGTYSVEYTITYNSDSSSVNGSASFDIYDYPTPVWVQWTSGYIWVESDRLCFLCGDWYKIRCKHDGTDYGLIGTAYAGHFWLETNGKIAYIDSLGHKRMTKKGDRYGWLGYASEIPSSPGVAYAGSIWASSDFNSYYLMIVSSDGVKYRIGAGYTDTGDYQ